MQFLALSGVAPVHHEARQIRRSFPLSPPNDLKYLEFVGLPGLLALELEKAGDAAVWRRLQAQLQTYRHSLQELLRQLGQYQKELTDHYSTAHIPVLTPVLQLRQQETFVAFLEVARDFKVFADEFQAAREGGELGESRITITLAGLVGQGTERFAAIEAIWALPVCMDTCHLAALIPRGTLSPWASAAGSRLN
jgi:hypothetical protein